MNEKCLCFKRFKIKKSYNFSSQTIYDFKEDKGGFIVNDSYVPSRKFYKHFIVLTRKVYFLRNRNSTKNWKEYTLLRNDYDDSCLMSRQESIDFVRRVRVTSTYGENERGYGGRNMPLNFALVERVYLKTKREIGFLIESEYSEKDEADRVIKINDTDY